MTSLSAIKSKLRSVNDIEEIVSSMKAFANFNVERAKKNLNNMRIYQKNIENSFADIITLFPGLKKENLLKTQKEIFVLFLSQEGLCGFFNEDILNYFNSIDYKKKDDTLIAIGTKGSQELKAKNIRAKHRLKGNSNIEAIPANAIELSSYLIRIYENEGFGKLTLIYAQLTDNKSYEIIKKSVLPMDFSRFSDSYFQKEPLLYLDPKVILHDLIKEYLHISIYRAFIESVASENQARLNAMIEAGNSIKKREKELTQVLNVQRQKEITEELLEIVNAYRSMIDEKSS